MPKTIKELQEIWEANKDGFKMQELGKLQDFIKDIFESKELFALAYGDLRKNNNKSRRNEFTRETTKEGAGSRRADLVIFIDGEDVVIPVEVEKHGNIKAGEAQILQYQTDWRKKYGILTDGEEWRLYFDRWYETFHLQDIFDKQSSFWKKWKLYTAPETYYDMAFNPKGQKELFESERLNPCAPENRPFFFNDITTLLTAFKAKIAALVPLFAKEDRQAVETTYSYVIQFILYKVLIDNNYQKLKNDYETFREWVQKAVRTKTYDEIIRGIKTIAEYIYKNVYEPFRQKQEDVNRRLIEQLKKSPSLEDIAPWLDIIMFIDRYDFSDIRNELFGFVYENYLKELYHEGNKGQYFTDPAVVNFMLEELGYTKEAVAKSGGKDISIIDPSCGAGTFLYSAALAIKEAFDNGTEANSKMIEELVNNNIFGLDMEEFPLFLAEMNILMQLLPVVVAMNYANPINEKLKLFITRDSIAEFLDTPINNGKEEHEYENGLFDGFNQGNTPTYMRARKDLVEMFRSLEGDLRTRRRFDYVVGNPPYIGYNQCGKFAFAKKIKEKNDKISMGNVYGVNLNTVPNRIKPYSPKPNLYAFFIALGLALLKEGGKICYIIPQTLLTAGDLDVLRYHLAKYTTIEKIITFEGKLFIGRGLTQKKPVPTSSLVFIAKKQKSSASHKVKIVNFETYTEKQAGDFVKYLKSKKKATSDILQTELLQNIENWSLIKQSKKLRYFLQRYEENSLSIEEYRLNTLSNYDEITIDGGVNLTENRILKSVPQGDFYKLFNPKSNNYKRYLISEDYQYYSKKSKIHFIPGGQGMKLFGNKYKVLWKTRFNDIFQFSSEQDLLMKGNQSLAISSNNKQVILFLFAILNSPVSLLILREMQKIPNESTYIVPITAIKQYIRIPKITANNKRIKAEIIRQTETLLELEKPVINDLVNFPHTAMQTYDFVRVVGNNLVLTKGYRSYTAKINRGKSELVKSAIETRYFPKTPLVPSGAIDIKELRFLPAIDFDEQAKVKSYIDDLVFALYFDLPLNIIGIENAAMIKKTIEQNEFYHGILAF